MASVDCIASSKCERMSHILIAAGVIGWSAIALAMSGCSSNSTSISTTPNANSIQNVAPASMAVVEQTVTTLTSSAPPASTPPATQTTVTSPQNLVPVPYVNPLNSIAIIAQQQNSDPAKSIQTAQLKPSAIPNYDRLNSSEDDRNITRLEQPDNISARPKFPNRNKSTPPICKVFPCLVLSQAPSHPQNRFNNPIYKLIAYRDKTSSAFQLDAVTGRGFTQTRNRYQSQTDAPLPDGSYSVSSRVVAGTLAEVGGTMVPIFPKAGFDRRMGRTALGIHWDPSFNKDKKEDGTSGCIGLTSKKNYHRVRDFILKYHPRSLEVQIE
jgi:hypothetical protein